MGWDGCDFDGAGCWGNCIDNALQKQTNKITLTKDTVSGIKTNAVYCINLLVVRIITEFFSLRSGFKHKQEERCHVYIHIHTFKCWLET